MPYTGPSRVPLPSAYELVAAGLWAAPVTSRDRSNDMTDEQITALL